MKAAPRSTVYFRNGQQLLQPSTRLQRKLKLFILITVKHERLQLDPTSNARICPIYCCFIWNYILICFFSPSPIVKSLKEEETLVLIRFCRDLKFPEALTSLLDGEQHRRAHRPHGTDGLALVLALVVSLHPGDAEGAGRQDHVTAVVR